MGSERVAPAARALAFIAMSLSLVSCGGPATTATTQPVASAPSPRAWHSVSARVFYEPAFSLDLRVDGAPLEGDVGLVWVPQGDTPDEPVTTRLRAERGVVTPDESATSQWRDGGTFALVLDGTTYPIAMGGHRGAHRCARAIAEIRAMSECTAELPGASFVSPFCDAEGQRVLTSRLGAMHAARDASCYLAIDEHWLTTIAATPPQSAVRARGCALLVERAGGDAIENEPALRLHEPCGPHLPQPVVKRITPELLRRRLPSAFEAAKQGSSEQMRTFVRSFAQTGDPRVAQVKQLALEKYGPADPKRFSQARSRLRALSRPALSVDLCDVKGDNATVVVFWHAWGALDRETADPDRSLVGFGAPRRRRPPPRDLDTVKQRAKAIAGANLGARTVTIVDACAVDHWYLE